MTQTDDRPHNPHLPIRPDWLARRQEEILDPALPIIDPHHHLWVERGGTAYLRRDLLADMAEGHDIRATVFVECKARYRTGGEEAMRPVGEVEFVVAEAGAPEDGGPRIGAGIVGYCDLRLGAAAARVLQAQIAAGEGRFRGIRNTSAWHPDPSAWGSAVLPPPGLLLEPKFREGFAQLAPLGLSFDAWMFHTQPAELRDLADAFPDTTIILNHIGGPLGIGPYAARRAFVFAEWRAEMQRLARHANVHVKLGGLGMRLFGFDVHAGEMPPSSQQLAAAWGPYIETCIELFGPERCMFESNFPMDKGSCSYAVLWNAFKRITAGCTAAERASLFHGTAARLYRLPPVT
ncbi:amidohydrolase family protein [Roseococcus sp.]|uniref:amidohydrolase family protein n=1 Tax=Roseococcus sp. TaxID=2109646 RepID=UPI003BAA3815